MRRLDNCCHLFVEMLELSRRRTILCAMFRQFMKSGYVEHFDTVSTTRYTGLRLIPPEVRQFLDVLSKCRHPKLSNNPLSNRRPTNTIWQNKRQGSKSAPARYTYTATLPSNNFHPGFHNMIDVMHGLGSVYCTNTEDATRNVSS